MKEELVSIGLQEFEDIIADCTCETLKGDPKVIFYYKEEGYVKGESEVVAKAIIDPTWRHSHFYYKIVRNKLKSLPKTFIDELFDF